MVTRSDGITPGTVPYGEREGFAAALDQAGQEQAPATGTPAATSGAAGVGGPLDPMQAMITGEIPPSSDPITSGLSVGPGDSPTQERQDPVRERLIYIATNAKSPKLRIKAREALRIHGHKTRSA